MFRLLILCAVAVLLLPTDAQQRARLHEHVSTGSRWAWTYCDRNPSACKTAGELWARASANAAFAVQLIADVAGERMAPAGSGKMPSPLPPAAGTLTSDDLRPVWRAHTGRPGA